MLWMILLLGFFFLGASGLLALLLALFLALGPSASTPAVRGGGRRALPAPRFELRNPAIAYFGSNSQASPSSSWNSWRCGSSRFHFRRRSWRPAPRGEASMPLE